jgi:hypothetical protein
MMARRADTYGGEWIKATQSGNIEAGPDMPRDDDRMILTIKGKATSHEWDDGKKQRVISFAETEMRLGLNATNWDSIAQITGQEDDDNWSGTVIELFVIPEPKSKTGHAIRVRKPRNAPAASTATTGRPMGKVAADRLILKLAEIGQDLPTLRLWLESKGKLGRDVNRPPEEWPSDWMAQVGEWLKNPVVPPKQKGEAGYTPIDESDIPF